VSKREWYMNVAVKPGSAAHASYVGRRTVRRGQGFPPDPAANLTYFGGRTIPHLGFLNLYVGGEDAWRGPERTNIDSALEAALADVGLNEVIQQYFANDAVEATMAPSRILPGATPAMVDKDIVEGWVTDLLDAGELEGFDLSTTVVDFMLPSGSVLTDAPSAHQGGEGAEPKAGIEFDEEAVDSRHGLGGYHGCVHGAGGGVRPCTTRSACSPK
jgi:hypothetical protein